MRPAPGVCGTGLIGLVLAAGGVVAGDVEPAVDEPAVDEHVRVVAEVESVGTTVLDAEALDATRASNLGLALGTIAGVAGVRRSETSFEPVIHGLGWERVQTQVDGLPLYGACPARMDPPAFVVAPPAARAVTVVTGLASVSLGPGGTGGRVDVSTRVEREPGTSEALAPWARLRYGSAADALGGGAGFVGGTETLDLAVGVERFEQRDYRTPDGLRVPASQTDRSASASITFRPSPRHRWSLGTALSDADDIAYPSLPMDTEVSTNRIYSAAYRFTPGSRGGALAELELTLGASNIDHTMSNRSRANRPMMEAETSSSARSARLGVATTWRTAGGAAVKAGLEGSRLDRDALRRRDVTAMDRTFFDHLWPDAEQDDLGAYGELTVAPSGRTTWRFGLRYDRVASRANAVDDPALGGGTIREAYLREYGPAAARIDRDEGLVSGNVLLVRRVDTRLTLEAGAGLASRAAGVTERYFAYALSSIGLLVGNPALDAERKREVALGARWEGSSWRLAGSAYRYDVADYIVPVVLEPDPEPIAGFRNTDATLTGIDLTLEWTPTASWTLPVSLAFVHGRDDARDVPLPEMPPAELRLAARRTLDGRLRGWIELGGRLVDDQHRVDPAFAENPTAGFAVWHARGRAELGGGLALELGLENLLDRRYVEHLTREAAANLVGLTPGQEIPAPGRSLAVGLTYGF